AQLLQQTVEQRIQLPALKGAWWGGFAAYADNPNQQAFSVLADTRFTPASTLKLLTTAAALHQLGPHYHFETNLYASATPQDNGTLEGDLIVQGGGDMTLGSTRVKGSPRYENVLRQWVQAVKKAGIRRIDGTIYADVSLFEGPAIADKVNWENMGNYFAAPASALSFNDNLFAIHFKGEPTHGKQTEVAAIDPQIPGVEIQNFVTADAKSKKDNAYVYGAPDQYNLKIFGSIPANVTGFTIKGAMPNPALFTVQALKQALEEEGIAVSGTPQLLTQRPNYATLFLLDTHYSPELKDIVVIINKRSFNLYADMLLRHLAIAQGKAGSIQNGLAALRKFLLENKIAGAEDTLIYDGSGLSRDDMITPRTLVNTLTFMANSPHFEYYYKSLATPDDRGDLLLLRRFLKPKHQVEEVRIKGGTIDGVKAVAGYVHDKDGRLISFAMIANNLIPRDETLWRAHEDIIKELLNLKQSPR
ncbi:MAG: D-alanyl-D-alanine carboxypeptidase/D-alanyl-D-alanine-endopeptidase, partial [Elusimicrobiaceae bacterium]|nr:D-alanyl-D-alanine carboxypeptidase/D-alanyl-D-alanine-endopeptidase [Elusimicrobiaceae bacterium]